METWIQISALVASAGLMLLIIAKTVRIVPQSEEHVVERLGRYQRTLGPGIRLTAPIIDTVRHRVSVLEEQLDSFTVNVITSDNVEVDLVTRVFMRVIVPERAVYHIDNYAGAVQTTATSLVRNAAGSLELDQVQGSREKMNQAIKEKLSEASEVWGIEITRTEIVNVIIDDTTKAAQRQQLQAERERRARVAEAEGERRAIELRADADLYEARRRAEGIRVAAEARAFEITTIATAQQEEIKRVGKAIKEYGTEAPMFEVKKRQIDAMKALAASSNSKVVVIPAEVTAVLGAIETIGTLIGAKGSAGAGTGTAGATAP